MKWQISLALAILSICAGAASAATWQVGPTRTYREVSWAVAAASDGDTIEIDSGTYVTNQAWGIYSKNDLTFRGVGPTRPIFDAHHAACNYQGIFVLYGNNTTVENIEFYNTRDAYDKNASGIRIIGAGLTVRNCYFHDCDDGIMGGANANSDILVENCEFDHCGYVNPTTGQPDQYSGYSHNLYIGNVRSFTLRHSWTHNAAEGHNIKTRAKANYILYNRISDENGTASYEVTVPNAGTTYIIGNLIQQGPNSHNGVIIDYGSEGASNPGKDLYVVNNTIINDSSSPSSTFVRNYAAVKALLQNNILLGPGLIAGGQNTQVSNLVTTNRAILRDATNFNYRLVATATGAINQGTAPGNGSDGFAMMPAYQYVHPYNRQERPTNGPLDIGAYEYTPNQAPTVSAGPDIRVYEGQEVQLHAAASDPDADPLGYDWAQPADPSIVLTGGATADLGFTAPAVATVVQASQTFIVAVSDGQGGNSSDSVSVRIRMLGDITGDDAVDVVDLLAFADAWGSVPANPGYDPLCDLSFDDTVDTLDLLTLADNWGRTLN